MGEPAAIYAVSDVHGHLDDLVAGLRAAGLVDDADQWTGGDAQLWVLGDLLDRGPDGLGVVTWLRDLQSRSPDNVHVLLGNHEALAIGQWRFPGSVFDPVWRRNGGSAADQAGLSHTDIAWLTALPAIAVVDDLLLVHSDATSYLSWGRTVDEVNRTVTSLLSGDEEACVEAWRGLTARYRFSGPDGPDRARDMLRAFGGERVVHGHSIINTMPGTDPFADVQGPRSYADGLALAIDGGRYDGGPLLVVRLDS